MWPGSPQTALIFVGLPLLTALVLLATPLHDAEPPPLRDEPLAALSADAPGIEPLLAGRELGTAAMPRAVSRRQPLNDADVPAVIYESRRPRPGAPAKARPMERRSAPAVLTSYASDTWSHPASTQSP